MQENVTNSKNNVPQIPGGYTENAFICFCGKKILFRHSVFFILAICGTLVYTAVASRMETQSHFLIFLIAGCKSAEFCARSGERPPHYEKIWRKKRKIEKLFSK